MLGKCDQHCFATKPWPRLGFVVSRASSRRLGSFGLCFRLWQRLQRATRLLRREQHADIRQRPDLALFEPERYRDLMGLSARAALAARQDLVHERRRESVGPSPVRYRNAEPLELRLELRTGTTWYTLVIARSVHFKP